MDKRHRLTSYLVVSDDPAFRQHLRLVLAEQVTDSCLLADGNLDTALPLALQLQPDLILLDACGSALHDLLGALVARQAGMRYLLFAPDWDDTAMASALAAGAHGCLRRDAPARTCLAAMHAIAAEDLWVPRQAITAAMALLGTQHTAAVSPDLLTGREHDVALAASQGLDNKQIARVLGMSPATVKTHLHHIFSKLGTTRRRLIMQGLRRP